MRQRFFKRLYNNRWFYKWRSSSYKRHCKAYFVYKRAFPVKKPTQPRKKVSR